MLKVATFGNLYENQLVNIVLIIAINPKNNDRKKENKVGNLCIFH